MITILVVATFAIWIVIKSRTGPKEWRHEARVVYDEWGHYVPPPAPAALLGEARLWWSFEQAFIELSARFQSMPSRMALSPEGSAAIDRLARISLEMSEGFRLMRETTGEEQTRLKRRVEGLYKELKADLGVEY